MSNELIQIYIDPDIEKQANDLFNRLGLDMSRAIPHRKVGAILPEVI